MAKKTLDEMMNALQKAADSYVPSLRNAFLDAIKEIRDNLASLDLIQQALLSQSIDSILTATGIDKLDPLLFGIGLNNDSYVFSTQAQSAFAAGATAAIGNLDVFRQKGASFNPLGERAVSVLRNRGSQMISDLTQTSKLGVRSVIERVITEGINPVKASAEIRQLIGLTSSQATAVTNFRRQLESQKNLGLMSPDKRRLNAVEQAMVRRHMKEGNFTDKNINDMVERYYQSLLNQRAITIARTESMSAVNAGQNEMWEQGLDSGIFDDNVDRKFWIVTPDDRLRATHAAIPRMNPNGVKIRSMFLTPFGPVYSPGDYNSNLINCRCIAILGEFGQSFTF